MSDDSDSLLPLRPIQAPRLNAPTSRPFAARRWRPWTGEPARSRAIALDDCARTLGVLTLGLALACSGDAERATASADPGREVRDLVAALTPPPPDVTSDVQDNWISRRRATLVRQRNAGLDVGREALRRFETEPGLVTEVRQGLLDVAAHNLPQAVAPRLEELVTTYGESLGLRTAACELLAEVAPQRAFALLEPIVREARHSMTYPPQEALVRAYAAGAWASSADPGSVLAEIATDLRQDDAARTVALTELARCVDGPHAAAAKQALETVLIESTGNGYLRRKAAQSIRDSFPAQEACALLERVADLEADLNFGMFLADMLAESCP